MGKIGSGKDLVGQIIQYLTCQHGIDGDRTFEESKGKIDIEGYGYCNFHRYNSPFEIHKFADSLKDIVCILIGCTREQLEDREFKEKELGEEWWYWCIFKTSQRVSYLDNKEFDKSDLSVNLIKPTVRELLQEVGTDAMRNVIHPNIWCNSLFFRL